MINIEFTEHSVFTYNAKDLTIHLLDHKDGKFEGHIIGCVGSIKFADKDQLSHFMEMLEFIKENVDDEGKDKKIT